MVCTCSENLREAEIKGNGIVLLEEKTKRHQSGCKKAVRLYHGYCQEVEEKYVGNVHLGDETHWKDIEVVNLQTRE